MTEQAKLAQDATRPKAATCRLCCSTNIQELFHLEHDGRVYSVLNCRTCELLQTLEHHEELSPDYRHLADSAVDANRLWCQGEHKRPAFEQWWAHARALVHLGGRKPRLLDIGCATGGFLRFASQRGFEVRGYDASQAQAAYAQRDLPDVRQADSPAAYLSAIEQPDLRFEVVTLWDVLEHIREPQRMLRAIRNVLAPRGLVYVSVPNGRAMLWKRRLYEALRRNRDADWIPWEHVFYYSPSSLERCLRDSGFQIAQAGAVVCYPRPISLFELVRRAGFLLLSPLPSWAPQIYAWAWSAE